MSLSDLDTIILLEVFSEDITLPEDKMKIHSNYISKMMINDLFGLMGDDWSIQDIIKYREDIEHTIRVLCLLKTFDLISSQQAKSILNYSWNNPYTSVSKFIIDNNLVNNYDPTELIKKIINDNPKIVEQIQSGKTKAIGFIVGQVMKNSKESIDAKKVQSIIKKELSVN